MTPTETNIAVAEKLGLTPSNILPEENYYNIGGIHTPLDFWNSQDACKAIVEDLLKQGGVTIIYDYHDDGSVSCRLYIGDRGLPLGVKRFNGYGPKESAALCNAYLEVK